MKRRTLLLIAGGALLIALLVLHANYLVSRARSAVVNASVEDVPGNAPAGTYPILLLHGFNPTYSKRVSEFSLHRMQDSIVEDLNYTNKGLLLPETTCAELRYASTPIVVRASYLDGLTNADIDAYAGNVKTLVEKLLSCTRAEQVDIITHSMGGIVVRHYLSSANATTVHRLIMLATPNHGGLYNIGALADYLAKQDEPLDIDFLALSENSEFMDSLIGEETSNTSGYAPTRYVTIAGDIDGKGDGLVLKESVRLPDSTNHVVPCSHIFIKNPRLCPEAYGVVKESLGEELREGRSDRNE